MKEKFNAHKLLSRASGLVKKLKDHKKKGDKQAEAQTTEEIKEVVAEITEAMNDPEATPEQKKGCSTALKAIAGLLLVVAGAFGIKTAVGKLKKAKDSDNPSNEINSTLNEIKSEDGEEISEKAEEALEMYCSFVTLESCLTYAMEAVLTGEDDEIAYAEEDEDEDEGIDDIEECGSAGWFESMEAFIECLETDLALEDFGMMNMMNQQMMNNEMTNQAIAANQISTQVSIDMANLQNQLANQQMVNNILMQSQQAIDNINLQNQLINQQNFMAMGWLNSITSQLGKNKKAKDTGDSKAERESIKELEKSTQTMDYAIDKAETAVEKKKISKGVKIVAAIAATIAGGCIGGKAIASQLEKIAKSNANPPRGIGRLIAKVAKLKADKNAPKAEAAPESFMDEYDDNEADECGVCDECGSGDVEFDDAMDCLNADLEEFCDDDECLAEEDNLGAMDRPTQDDEVEGDESYTTLDSLLDLIL